MHGLEARDDLRESGPRLLYGGEQRARVPLLFKEEAAQGRVGGERRPAVADVGRRYEQAEPAE
ncbi:hypothetical protein ACIQEY_05670 [Streptomyces parvus]|uniref:hypothetical protein n=1 Tax=Streptomyces parvus TaxID=66428 RepID=UPI0036398638